MKCPQCNTEYIGNYCPQCGTAVTVKKEGKLFGFRSRRVWKMILSVVYLVFCCVLLLSVISIPIKGQITTYDFVVNKVSSAVLLLIFFSPYIFLSNTKFRDCLPFLRNIKLSAAFWG